MLKRIVFVIAILMFWSRMSSGQAVQISCPGAPPSHLLPGMQAMVRVSGAGEIRETLRVRSEPGGEVITSLAEGTLLNIKDAPICLNGVLWWPLDTGFERGWSVEAILDSDYFIVPIEDQGVTNPPINFPPEPESIVLSREAIEHITWRADSKALAVAGGGAVWLYDSKLQLMGTLGTLGSAYQGITAFDWSKDGRSMIIGGERYGHDNYGVMLSLWDVTSATLTSQLVNADAYDPGVYPRVSTALQFTSDSQRFYNFAGIESNYWGFEPSIQSWFVDAGTVENQYQPSEEILTNNSWTPEDGLLSPDGKYLMVKEGNLLVLRDALTLEAIKQYGDPQESYCYWCEHLKLNLTWDANSKQVAFVKDNHIAVLNIEEALKSERAESDPSSFVELTLTEEEPGPLSLAFLPDNRLSVLMKTGHQFLWDLNSGEIIERSTLSQPNRVFINAAYSPDATRIVSISDDMGLRMWDAVTGKLLHAIFDHSFQVPAGVVWNGDGTRLVSRSVANYSPMFGDESEFTSSLQIWDMTKTGNRAITSIPLINVITMFYSPDYRVLNVTNQRKRDTAETEVPMQQYDAETGELLMEYPLQKTGFIQLGRWSKDGSTFGNHLNEGGVNIWNAQGELLFSVPKEYQALMWASDVDRLVTRDRVKNEVQIWDGLLSSSSLPEPKILKPQGERQGLGNFSISADGRLLAFAPSETQGLITVWDIESGEQIVEYRDPNGLLSQVSFTPNSDHLLVFFSAWSDSIVQILDISSGEIIATLDEAAEASHFAWSRDGKRLATAGGYHNTTVSVWDVHGDTYELVGAYDDHRNAGFENSVVFGIAWNPAGDRLATTGLDGTVRVRYIPR